MQMKKIVSVVAAAAMAAAFCVPAYAEGSATPGRVAEDIAIQIMEDVSKDWEGNKAEASAMMKEMTSQIRADSDITVSEAMTDAALAYFDAAEDNGDSSISKSVGVEPYYGTGMVYRKDADASDLTVNDFGYDYQGVITVDATEGSTSSDCGYAISVTLPADGENYGDYIVTIENGQKFDGPVEPKYYTDKNGQELCMLTFWAPHFTTYKLIPVNASQNQGGEQQTVTSDDSSSSSSDESTAASTTTATTATVAENPIKATGVSMNLSVFAVVACAAVAACGAGVAVKKSHKGE